MRKKDGGTVANGALTAANLKDYVNINKKLATKSKAFYKVGYRKYEP